MQDGELAGAVPLWTYRAVVAQDGALYLTGSARILRVAPALPA